MDIWGVAGVDAEAELLAAVVHSMQSMGLRAEHVAIKVNSRKLLQDIFTYAGISSSQFAAACVIVDKLDKLPEDAVLEELLTKCGIASEQGKQLFALMKERDLVSLHKLLGHSGGCEELSELFELLHYHGIQDWIVFDPSVVRGLSYYTGVVFEGVDRAGKLRAIFGGGRYDKLLESFGSAESIPAVGFGFGDAVITELLDSLNLLATYVGREVQVVVYAANNQAKQTAIECATYLRDKGIVTELLLGDKKTKWALQRADKLKSDAVVLCGMGGDTKKLEVKNMKTGEQKVVQSFDEILKQ